MQDLKRKYLHQNEQVQANLIKADQKTNTKEESGKSTADRVNSHNYLHLYAKDFEIITRLTYKPKEGGKGWIVQIKSKKTES